MQNLKALYEKYKQQNTSNEKVTIILQNILKNNSNDLDYLFDMFCNDILEIISNIMLRIESRDYNLFRSRLEGIYSQELFKQVKFAELKEDIIDINLTQSPMPFAVNKVIYSDSPICVGRPLDYDDDCFD